MNWGSFEVEQPICHRLDSMLSFCPTVTTLSRVPSRLSAVM